MVCQFSLFKYKWLRHPSVIGAGNSYFQPLSWNLRMKVALGAAKGLAYLHSPEARVIYRDFKTSNILLDSVSETLQFLTPKKGFRKSFSNCLNQTFHC